MGPTGVPPEVLSGVVGSESSCTGSRSLEKRWEGFMPPWARALPCCFARRPGAQHESKFYNRLRACCSSPCLNSLSDNVFKLSSVFWTPLCPGSNSLDERWEG